MIFTNVKKRFERIELPVKLLDYYLRSNKNNINQTSNDPEIKNAQSRLQAAWNDPQMAKESSAFPNTIKGHVDEVKDANNHMKRTQHLQRQQFAATEVTGQVQKIPSDKHSMWDLLRAYKTDHTKFTLPE